MATKRAAAVDSCPGPSSEKKSKRQLSVNTFEKWQGQYDKDYGTLSWLRCVKDPSNRTLVSELWCEVCRKYEARIFGSKNFSKVSKAGFQHYRLHRK